jgi:hypothetical protein
VEALAEREHTIRIAGDSHGPSIPNHLSSDLGGQTFSSNALRDGIGFDTLSYVELHDDLFLRLVHQRRKNTGVSRERSRSRVRDASYTLDVLSSQARPDHGKRRIGRDRLIQATCFLIGAAAAAYLWAVVFGDAIPGLKSGAALDKSNSDFPNANAAFLVAVATYLTTPFAAWWFADFAAAHNHNTLKSSFHNEVFRSRR